MPAPTDFHAPPKPRPDEAQPPAAALLRGRGRPRKSAAERDDGNRRQALLRAAAVLFRQHGFAATRTRDIAAAAGMQAGSPFYHFENKAALLAGVMEEGMQRALAHQAQAMAAAELREPIEATAPLASPRRPGPALTPDQRQDRPGPPDAPLPTATAPASAPRAAPTAQAVARLRVLVRSHFEVLLGPDSDFVPVMLYEWRCLSAVQRSQVKRLKGGYEAAWVPVLTELHRSGALCGDPRLVRLMLFGALNWTVQWYDPGRSASLNDLTESALALFLKAPA